MALRHLAMAVLIAGGLLGATGANATIYSVTVTGTITAERACSPDDLNTCIDANLAVGDHLTFSARFNSGSVQQWGNLGYDQAGLYGLPTSGAAYWRVTAPGGLLWTSLDDEFDGSNPFFTSDTVSLADPAVIFSGSSVLGLSGYMIPVPLTTRPSPPPILVMGSQTAMGYSNVIDGVTYSFFPPAQLGDIFQIDPGEGFYGNIYNSPGFLGVWDFADARISAIPEPAIWTMMLVGFGGLGAVMRSSRRERVRAT